MSGTGFPGPPPDPNVYFGQPIVPVAAVTIALSTLFIAMRFWSRAVILCSLGLEDGFILLGWVFAVGTSGSNLIELKYGLGRQYAALDRDTLTNNLKISFATNVIYAFALLFVKISILCLYIRVLTYNTLRVAAKVMLGIVVVTHAWIIISIFTGCVPLAGLWDFVKHATAYCHPGSVYWSHAGLNIATDFLIFLLPLPVLRKIRIPWRQKVALYCVFLLAFCVCIISILRTVQFGRALIINPAVDKSKDGVIIAIWTMLEVNIAVVCACLTTIKPVLSRFFPRLLTPDGGSDDGTSESSWGGDVMEQAMGGNNMRPPRRSVDGGDIRGVEDGVLGTDDRQGIKEAREGVDKARMRDGLGY